jgi:acyl-CoA dehydrogenase
MLTHAAPKANETTLDWLARAEHVANAASTYARLHDSERSFVSEAFGHLKELGFFKALVPVEFGGGGARYGDLCQAIRVIARSCGSTGLAFSMHTHLVAAAVWRWRHQKAPLDGLLRRIAVDGLVLVSSGGSDWLNSSGAAVKVEGGFRITARKIFSSGCPAGDLLMTSAVYEDPDAGPTVLHFAVSLQADGVTLSNNWDVLGMRGTGSHDIALNNVFIPDAAISGRRPQGRWHPLFHIISMIAFPLVYSAYVGVAEGARTQALQIAKGKPADEHLWIRVGAMENAMTEATLALEKMVEIGETGEPNEETTSRIMVCRTLAGRAAIETVTAAMEVVGGASYYRSLALERAFRDIQGARFHPLQERPQERYTGRVLLGLDIDG